MTRRLLSLRLIIRHAIASRGVMIIQVWVMFAAGLQAVASPAPGPAPGPVQKIAVTPGTRHIAAASQGMHHPFEAPSLCTVALEVHHACLKIAPVG